MSIQFSDTDTKRGLVQFFEKEIGVEYGVISDDTTEMLSFTADVNNALDDFTRMAIQAEGTWNYDDSNYEDYPTITRSIVSGRREYKFTVDDNNSIVLDIYKVYIKTPQGIYVPLNRVDVQSQEEGTERFYDGQNIQGTPTSYDKRANAITFDLIPNYNDSAGIKAYVNREGSYFSVTDTIKKPGVPGDLHKYFYLKPAREYARRNTLAIFDRLDAEVAKYEGVENVSSGIIRDRFSHRVRDERPRMSVKRESNK